MRRGHLSLVATNSPANPRPAALAATGQRVAMKPGDILRDDKGVPIARVAAPGQAAAEEAANKAPELLAARQAHYKQLAAAELEPRYQAAHNMIYGIRGLDMTQKARIADQLSKAVRAADRSITSELAYRNVNVGRIADDLRKDAAPDLSAVLTQDEEDAYQALIDQMALIIRHETLPK